MLSVFLSFTRHMSLGKAFYLVWLVENRNGTERSQKLFVMKPLTKSVVMTSGLRELHSHMWQYKINKLTFWGLWTSIPYECTYTVFFSCKILVITVYTLCWSSRCIMVAKNFPFILDCSSNLRHSCGVQTPFILSGTFNKSNDPLVEFPAWEIMKYFVEFPVCS